MDQKLVRSIKIWAIILGVLSLFALWTLSVYPIVSIRGILSLIGLILGLAVLYVGVQLTSVSLQTAAGVFWAKFIVLVIDFLLLLIARPLNLINLVVVIVEGIIAWYLIMSLKKLSRG
jgi:hypothetical protein